MDYARLGSTGMQVSRWLVFGLTAVIGAFQRQAAHQAQHRALPHEDPADQLAREFDGIDDR